MEGPLATPAPPPRPPSPAVSLSSLPSMRDLLRRARPATVRNMSLLDAVTAASVEAGAAAAATRRGGGGASKRRRTGGVTDAGDAGNRSGRRSSHQKVDACRRPSSDNPQEVMCRQMLDAIISVGSDDDGDGDGDDDGDDGKSPGDGDSDQAAEGTRGRCRGDRPVVVTLDREMQWADKAQAVMACGMVLPLLGRLLAVSVPGICCVVELPHGGNAAADAAPPASASAPAAATAATAAPVASDAGLRERVLQMLTAGFSVLQTTAPSPPPPKGAGGDGNGDDDGGGDGQGDGTASAATLSSVAWVAAGVAVQPDKASLAVPVVLDDKPPQQADGVFMTYANGSVVLLTVRPSPDALRDALLVSAAARSGSFLPSEFIQLPIPRLAAAAKCDSPPVALFSYVPQSPTPVTAAAVRPHGVGASRLLLVRVGHPVNGPAGVAARRLQPASPRGHALAPTSDVLQQTGATATAMATETATATAATLTTALTTTATTTEATTAEDSTTRAKRPHLMHSAAAPPLAVRPPLAPLPTPSTSTATATAGGSGKGDSDVGNGDGDGDGSSGPRGGHGGVGWPLPPGTGAAVASSSLSVAIPSRRRRRVVGRSPLPPPHPALAAGHQPVPVPSLSPPPPPPLVVALVFNGPSTAGRPATPTGAINRRRRGDKGGSGVRRRSSVARSSAIAADPAAGAATAGMAEAARAEVRQRRRQPLPYPATASAAAVAMNATAAAATANADVTPRLPSRPPPPRPPPSRLAAGSGVTPTSDSGGAHTTRPPAAASCRAVMRTTEAAAHSAGVVDQLPPQPPPSSPPPPSALPLSSPPPQTVSYLTSPLDTSKVMGRAMSSHGDGGRRADGESLAPSVRGAGGDGSGSGSGNGSGGARPLAVGKGEVSTPPLSDGCGGHRRPIHSPGRAAVLSALLSLSGDGAMAWQLS
ncbi:hypothetical protein MMPV_000949 [Pyropia vietnamensis]